MQTDVAHRPGTLKGPTMEYHPGPSSSRNYSFLVNASDFDAVIEKPLNYAMLPLSILIVWTFLGNALVLIAVYRERSLKSMSNYVIASLALADLLLAVLVMPLSLVSVVSY